MNSGPQLSVSGDESVEVYIESASVGSLLNRLLARITEGEVLTRYFSGQPDWDSIKNFGNSKPTDIISYRDKDTKEMKRATIARCLAMFLVNTVCATIAREAKLGLRVSQDGDFTYLSEAEKENMRRTIAALVDFVQIQLCVDVEINPGTETFFIR